MNECFDRADNQEIAADPTESNRQGSRGGEPAQISSEHCAVTADFGPRRTLGQIRGQFGTKTIEPAQIQGGEHRGTGLAGAVKNGVPEVNSRPHAERLSWKITDDKTCSIHYTLIKFPVSR